MQILVNANFDLMGKRKLALVVSGLALLISIGSLIVNRGPRLSIDFTGGTFVQVAFDTEVPTEELRSVLVDGGIPSAEIQQIAGRDEFIIRMKNEEVAAVSRRLLGESHTVEPFGAVRDLVKERLPDVGAELRRQETVGPKIGSELRERAVQSILVALVLMLVYIALRFAGVFFALGAVAALFHDVILTLGVFSIMGIEVSLTILAALLTIAGYSINDTIVVFDRIREQQRAMRRETMEHVINRSVNLTLSRTVLTSLTTLFAVMALYVAGGPVIHDFAFAVLIGVLVGTYSSIFVASTLVLTLHNWRAGRERGKRQRGARKPKAVAKPA